MKGRVIPSKVRMNQEGWTMMNIFRFFFSLWDKRRREREENIKSLINNCDLLIYFHINIIDHNCWRI